jgi:hypothetical protein
MRFQKLTEDERCSVKNVMSVRSLFVPHEELETNIYSPKEAVEFFSQGLLDEKIKPLL